MKAAKAPRPAGSGPRIRNKGIVKVRVGDLVEQGWNPATHPDEQAELLDAAIDEVGWFGR